MAAAAVMGAPGRPEAAAGGSGAAGPRCSGAWETVTVDSCAAGAVMGPEKVSEINHAAGGRASGTSVADQDKSGFLQRALVSAYARLESSGIMDSALGRAAYAHAYFAYKRHLEDPFARLVRRFPEPFLGGDILDVGANIGYTAAVFAAAASPGRRVWAFEPERRNFEMLQQIV